MKQSTPTLAQLLNPHCNLHTDTYALVLLIYPHKADIISTVEFDHTGDYLATGDKGGRVVLFERNEGVSFSLFDCLLMSSAWCCPNMSRCTEIPDAELYHGPSFLLLRKRAASTDSTPSSNHTSQSSTTSRV
jgi:hypothetical protein